MPNNSNNSTWGKALKDQVVWFVFAVILAAGTTYFQVQIRVETIESNLANAKKDLQDIEEQQESLDQKREELRLQINNLDQKIDALLRDRGINPQTLERLDK